MLPVTYSIEHSQTIRLFLTSQFNFITISETILSMFSNAMFTICLSSSYAAFCSANPVALVSTLRLVLDLLVFHSSLQNNLLRLSKENTKTPTVNSINNSAFFSLLPLFRTNTNTFLPRARESRFAFVCSHVPSGSTNQDTHVTLSFFYRLSAFMCLRLLFVQSKGRFFRFNKEHENAHSHHLATATKGRLPKGEYNQLVGDNQIFKLSEESYIFSFNGPFG